MTQGLPNFNYLQIGIIEPYLYLNLIENQSYQLMNSIVRVLSLL